MELLRKTVSGVMLTLLLTSMLMLAFNIQSVKAGTITVPDDYPTIQEAINAAEDGDTIYVRSGIYYETLGIRKSVAVIGEDRETTVIDGGGHYCVVYVTASNVTISGFTIRNGSTGIKIGWGPGWTYIYYTKIVENTIINNTYRGILLRGLNGIIYNNTITSNREGIYLDVAMYNNISYNMIASNYESGIQIAQASPGNIFRDNNLSGNTWNFGVFAGNTYDFVQDIDSSNTVDGKPIYYLVNEHDKQVPTDAGYVAAINCVNITIRDLSLTNNLQGMLFAGTTNSTVENVKVSNNWIGMHLMLASSQNIIYNNTIKNNEWRGIELMVGCSQNNMSRNTITSNIPIHTSTIPWYIPIYTPKMGIGLSLFGWSHENILKNNWIALNGYGIYIGSDRPDNNTVSENTIIQNYLYGIYISHSSGNLIFHNIFLDNWKQVQTIGSTNIWDADHPSGGNYWSDYTGEDADSDGIGDSAYVIDENNQDRYPLMAPWTPPAEHELVVVLQTPILLQLGDSAILNATVANKGLHSETDITLSIIINGTIAESITIPLLQPNSLYTLSYRWTPSNEGTYNVTAYAAELLGEENIANNMFTLFVKVKTPIVVPDDYASIKEAVNTAKPEDIVFVKAGTYNEDILVDKFGLRLVGENPATTIITKEIKITAHKVSIINFTIQGWDIEIESSQGCILTGNTMTNGGDIELRYSSNNVLTGNNIAPSRYGADIELESSNNNIIFENNIWGSIELHDSSGNSISENNITKSGIQLRASSNNEIYGNSITNSSAGITLLWTSHKNTICGNTITNGEYGIRLSGLVGVRYRECPENNIIYRNNIANNTKAGVELGGAGISPGGALNNIFYHNNFLSNTPQVQIVHSYKNIWDNGYPSGGNYWSNYTGVDRFSGSHQNVTGSDGIGDAPYTIDANNTDRYPLMNSWPSGPGLHELEVTLEAPIRLTLGRSTLLNVTVSNKGVFKEENVTLFLFVNDTIVNYKTISLLEVDSSYTTSYLWTPVTAGRVNVTVYATPVLGEIYVTNNQKTKLVRVSSKPPVHNINTGLYYETIQEAIDANETLDGHTIKVEADVYYENVAINKSVSLLGENPDVTIIDAGEIGTVVTVTANNVNISNFTLRNSGNSFQNAGVYLDNVQGSNISGNNIINNRYGVGLNSSSGNTISGNDITANSYGVYLSGSSYNNIFGNNITANNWYSIKLYYSSNNSIVGNNIANNWYGILLSSSSNNTISGNNIANNWYGIKLYYSSNNSISGNTFSKDGLFVWDSYGNVVVDNYVNGKPLVYLEGVSDFKVGDAGQVILINSVNITVEGLNLSSATVGIELWGTNNTKIAGNNITANNRYGIELHFSSNNNSISGNNITNNGDGIELHFSSNNSISGNNIANNQAGILLDSSSNNSISGNNIANNQAGILLDSSSNNSISGNNIASNRYGIILYSSSNNSIYHNNFIVNTHQVYIYAIGYANIWDDGYPSGGNYWSDYNGADLFSGPYQNVTCSDGIGDTSYVIDGDNIDRFPLMGPINIFDAGTWNELNYYVDVISNSTISDFYFNPEKEAFLKFNVTGENGTAGFCRVTIPKDLLWVEDGWTVLVGGQTITDYKIIPDENCTYLYFTYNHTTKIVIIQGTDVIPEFPQPIIQLLLAFATLIATILLKKKRKTNPNFPNEWRE